MSAAVETMPAKPNEAKGARGTPPKSAAKRVNLVTPGAKVSTSLDRRMTVDKDIVDELLLVCGVIGTTTGRGNEIVPVTDCLNWLQDLQRALRRDDDNFRPISLLIGKWKVVEQKLLPLVMTCRYDVPIVLTVVKILVILTKPLAEQSKRAGRMTINTTKNQDVVQQQIKLRENALEQSRLLMEYKRIIIHHSSHHSKGKGTGLLSIFVSLLAEPLSRSGTARTDADHLTIELVLHLFRNILAAEPLLKTSQESAAKSTQLHQELISLLDKELVFKIFLVLASEMEARENAPYNLLIMELLNHMLKHQDPVAVVNAAAPSGVKAPRQSSGLLAKLKEEKDRRLKTLGTRHGHFGGTWMTQKRSGDTVIVGAGTSKKTLNHTAQPTRKTRESEPFIGSGRSLLAYSRKTAVDTSPASERASLSLNSFCQRFMKSCYGPVMKSLKNEFRRDSSRLESGDKVVFFRIAWFFSQWWRLSKTNESIGHLVFTMDVFSFNLVLTSMDTFHERKQYTRLAQAVALYTEMIHLLYVMHTSKDSTENLMSKGLLDRLFYGSEPLDRLPVLLSRWSPGLTTREYACDLVELCHISLKLLESNQRQLKQLDGVSKEDKVDRMKSTASQFDVAQYFSRKIFSNKLVLLYTHLLGHYKINATSVNHRIMSMFLRLQNTEIFAAEDGGDRDDQRDPLARRRVTLGPVLYNFRLLTVLEAVLNDATLRHDDSFKPLVSFATNLIYQFWEVMKANPMMLVECLFTHTLPHRHCDLITNQYVGEELRMLAERDRLLEEQRGYMENQSDDDNLGNGMDDEEEAELELGDESPPMESAPGGESKDHEKSKDDDEDEAPVDLEGMSETQISTNSVSDSERSTDDKDTTKESGVSETLEEDSMNDETKATKVDSRRKAIVDSDDDEGEAEFELDEETLSSPVDSDSAKQPEDKDRSNDEAGSDDITVEPASMAGSPLPKPESRQGIDNDSDDEGEAEFEEDDSEKPMPPSEPALETKEDFNKRKLETEGSPSKRRKESVNDESNMDS